MTADARDENVRHEDSRHAISHYDGAPSLEVTLAGVRFRSPIGLAPIGGGSHFGGRDPDEVREHEVRLRFLRRLVRAGTNSLVLNVSYLAEDTLAAVLREAPPGTARPRGGWGERTMNVKTGDAPYGLEGLYSAVSPGPGTPAIEVEKAILRSQAKLVDDLKRDLPDGVPIVGGLIGCGGLPDAYVDAARACEGLGVDLVEVNFHCPLQAGMRHALDAALDGRFPPYSQGGLMVEHPDLIERVVGAVVAVVDVPVGVKFSAEVGFPRIVGLARRVRDAGAKYVHVGGAAVGIAPPDIYDRGRPTWPFAASNPFCLTSGSWMRRSCYRDIAAVARFVPGIDIAASGGLVTPEHCIEAMMLGATITQHCTAVMEQGTTLLGRSNAFLREFLSAQGYAGAHELIGLGQPYIEYSDEADIAVTPAVARWDQERCTLCGHCWNNMCVAISPEEGCVRVDSDLCTGCGACTIACQNGALSLVHRTGVRGAQSDA